MSYDTISLIKQQAKALSKTQGVSLSSAQELFARKAKFSNFHDLTTVATRNPDDPRLVCAAFGVSDLKDAIWEDDLPSQLDDLLEDATSEARADMNASDFRVTSLKITSADYDPALGKLVLDGSFVYGGQQDLDRMYHGTAFHMNARFNLIRRFDSWSFDENTPYEIVDSITDSDLDREHELEYQYEQYLAEKAAQAKRE
ncbi:hypothetical protein [Pseudomonas sp. Irchel s3f19]|uniref:hypothetical protein n=1 Tax=Pseudomonas sp. Irchel s3f19 TaxID=2009146 RepID=UPI000BA4B0BC|nr:hypothetical protein [Pseudomonas sp. Irchel s3f19]